MEVGTAMRAWEGLREIAGDEAKVHFTGGEPFLYWERLCEILEEGKRRGLGTVDLIETDGFWAEDEEIIKERLSRLDALGMERLKVSCDPFHQEYVDVELVRRLAEVGAKMLGESRVMVRWREYAEKPVDIRNATEEERMGLYLKAMADYPCRYTGRAGGKLAERAACKPLEELRGLTCKGSILGAKGVHVDPFGNVFSGTCSGIIVGNVKDKPLEKIWEEFDPEGAEVIERLFTTGPAGLLDEAKELGYQEKESYASKCHLCWDPRQFLFEKGRHEGIIGPAECYIE